jgi:hypothetical protein
MTHPLHSNRRLICGFIVDDFFPDPTYSTVERPLIVASLARRSVDRWLNVVQIDSQLIHSYFPMTDGRCIVELEAVIEGIFRRAPNACVDAVNLSVQTTIIDFIVIDITTSLDGLSHVSKALYPDCIFPFDRQISIGVCPSLRLLYEIPDAHFQEPADGSSLLLSSVPYRS